MKKIELLIVDPQVDFVETTGALSIPGALDDMARIAAFIDTFGSNLSDIHVTLDSHQAVHIAHPIWFISKESKKHPQPFTDLACQDLDFVSPSGELFETTSPKMAAWTRYYFGQLQKLGKTHTIWPPHCIMGEPGHAIAPVVAHSLRNWSNSNLALVDYVFKGMNHRVEAFSAVKAEVVDTDDPSTKPNKKLLHSLEQADEVIVCGEASTHCVKNTVLDLILLLGVKFASKCVFLEDATSPVTGFESAQDAFFMGLRHNGVKLTTCRDYLA